MENKGEQETRELPGKTHTRGALCCAQDFVRMLKNAHIDVPQHTCEIRIVSKPNEPVKLIFETYMEVDQAQNLVNFLRRVVETQT